MVKLVKLKKKYLIILLVLFISVGFAYLSSSLFMSGVIGYKASSWDVHFENVDVINNIDDTKVPVINENKNQIDFSVHFNEPGEIYSFTVEVVNSGTIDAMVSEIVKSGITDENEEYIDYSIKYYDNSNIINNDLLRKKTRTKIIVLIEYNYDISKIQNLDTQNFSITLNYVRATDEANDTKHYFNSNESSEFVNDAKENSIFDYKLLGNSVQNAYEGSQLVHKMGVGTPKDDSDFWQDISSNCIAMDDGWLNITGYNNTSDDVVELPFFIKKEQVSLQPDTDYTVFIEYKGYSGNADLVISSDNENDPFVFNNEKKLTTSQLSNAPEYNVKNFNVHTKESLENTYGLRLFLRFPSGKKHVSITFRVMIVKGTKTRYDYEPYVGERKSPNPDYPQEIKNMTGETSVKFKGKNLLNYNNNLSNIYSVDADGYITSKTPSTDSRYWSYATSNYKMLLPKGEYTLSFDFEQQCVSGHCQVEIRTDEETLVLKLGYNSVDKISKSFTLDSESMIGLIIKGYDAKYRIQIESGNKATEWEPYKERNVPISLGNIELNKIGKYQDYIYYKNDKWYIHKEITSSKISPSFVIVVNNTFYNSSYNNYTYSVNRPLCTHFIGRDSITNGTIFDETYDFDNVGFNLEVNYNRLYIKTKNTLSELKQFLNGNDVIIYYAMRNPQEIEITDENLIEQLNYLLENNLFDGFNNISFSGNITSEILFNYYSKNY